MTTPLTPETMTTHDTLLAFSEWLDSEQHVMRKPRRYDDDTHDDLARKFIEWWQSNPDRAVLAGQPARRERVDPDLRASLAIAADILDANPTEDTCRHGNDVWTCDGADDDGCTDRSRRELIRDLAATPDHTVVGEEREA